MDTRLFVRGKCTELPFHYSASLIDTDTRFTTHYDYILARFQANERLREYLLTEIAKLKDGYPVLQPPCNRTGLRWTGSKVHLTELAYALAASGQINSGTVGVQEVTGRLEELFGVKLGGVYRTYQEIRQRKRDSRTKFLDLMKENLLRRMDELDGA